MSPGSETLVPYPLGLWVFESSEASSLGLDPERFLGCFDALFRESDELFLLPQSEVPLRSGGEFRISFVRAEGPPPPSVDISPSGVTGSETSSMMSGCEVRSCAGAVELPSSEELATCCSKSCWPFCVCVREGEVLLCTEDDKAKEASSAVCSRTAWEVCCGASIGAGEGQPMHTPTSRRVCILRVDPRWER